MKTKTIAKIVGALFTASCSLVLGQYTAEPSGGKIGLTHLTGFESGAQVHQICDGNRFIFWQCFGPVFLPLFLRAFDSGQNFRTIERLRLGVVVIKPRIASLGVLRGEAIVHMAGLPLDANVLFMTLMATKMPYVGRG